MFSPFGYLIIAQNSVPANDHTRIAFVLPECHGLLQSADAKDQSPSTQPFCVHGLLP